MAQEEQQSNTTPQDQDFFVGKNKVSDGYYGSAKVSRGSDGLPKWFGSEQVERDVHSRALKIGGNDIVRNPSTGAIEKLGDEAISWKEEEKLRKFLDGKL